MTITVGSVQVEILPDVSKFRQRLDSELRNLTSVQISVSADLAEARAKIEELVRARTVDLNFRVNGAPTGRQGTQAGNDYADAFSRIVKTKVEAALRSLPDVQVGVATTEAEQKLKDFQVELARIRDGKVGVDFTADEALAKIEEFRRHLIDVGAQSPDVQVRADTRAAVLELDKVRAELDRLDGKTADVTVREHHVSDGDTSSGGLSGGGLLAAAAPLAALAIPIGAAAIGGIAALGAGAAVGVGALGALKLGLSGVGTAVQAVQAQQKSAGADAVTYANAQASAASAVTSASAGLDNARRSAGVSATNAARAVTSAEQAVTDAQRSASASVITALASETSARTAVVDAQRSATAAVASALVQQESAERSLTSAQQAETSAQNALTLARRTAQQQIEDLTNSVADGALAQRAAALQVLQAQHDLDVAKVNPAATEFQREQAQLTYDQALQQTTDLATRQQRLVADKATADKAGVDGSLTVVAAQQAVGNATTGVATAQDGLARASAAVTEAQRAGAENVQKAQDALLRSTTAVTEARRAGAESVAKAEQAVTVAQQAQDDQAASSAASITSAQDSLANALRQQAVAAAAVSSSALAAKQALDALTPAGRIFAEFVAGTLEPALKRLKTAAGDGLLPGLQAGITAALPLLPVFVDIVGNLSTALGGLFTSAGRALNTPFYQQFFGYLSTTAGPALTTLGRILGGFITGSLGLLQGFGPVISQVGGGVLGLSDSFAKFGTTLSTNAGFQSFLGYVIASGPLVASTLGDLVHLIGTLAEGLAPLGFVLLQVTDQVAKLLIGMGPTGLLFAIGAVAAILVPFTGGITAIAFAVTGLVGGFLSLYNSSKGFHDLIDGQLLPVLRTFGGTVLSGVTTGLGYAKKAYEDNKPAVDALVGGLGLLLGALVKVGFFLSGQAIKIAFEGIGLVVGALFQGIGLLVGAFKTVIDVGARVLGALADVPGFGWAKDGATLLGGLSVTLDHVGSSSTTTSTSLTNAGTAAGYTQDKADKLAAANTGLKTAQDNLNTAIQTSVDKFTILNGGVLAQQKAADNLAASEDALAKSVADNGTSLDGNTEKGRANKAAIEGALSSLNDKIAADFRANESTMGHSKALEIANQQLVDGKAKLEAQAAQLGLNKDQTDALVSSILKTPDTITTDFQNNLTQAQQDIATFQAAVDAIHGKDIKIGVQGYIQGGAGNEIIPGQGAIPKADGGHIIGAGTGTSDSIPARLSNGEFVVKATQTAKFLPLLHAINDGRVPGFATGGVVRLQGSDDFAGALAGVGTFLNGLTSDKLLGVGAASGVLPAGDPVGRWGPLILQALGLQGLPASNLGGVEQVIRSESGGNPLAINLTDSNALAGHPSIGLMQTIGSTFLGNAGPFANRGITDPFANIYAGIHYAVSRYGPDFFSHGGNHDAGGNYLGYARGGPVFGPGTGTSDSVPLLASTGEFIVNARDAQKNLSLLQYINSGALSGGPAPATFSPAQLRDHATTTGGNTFTGVHADGDVYLTDPHALERTQRETLRRAQAQFALTR